MAGRIWQEYNIRKKRKGAFWQDRYHATAVETGEHLRQCLVYIDLNMVRAGIIDHPSQWYWCGYNEIQNPRRKNVLIDYERLGALTGFNTFDSFQAAHRSWVDASLATHDNRRERRWSESIAVGSNTFTTDILSQLGSRAKGREIIEKEQSFQIREETKPYNPLFDGKKGNIGPKNTFFGQQDAR